eukprot:3231892-Rhodomonas_salina.2
MCEQLELEGGSTRPLGCHCAPGLLVTSCASGLAESYEQHHDLQHAVASKPHGMIDLGSKSRKVLVRDQ